MRDSDVKEQINKMYDERDKKHHWIEDFREKKWKNGIKNWFSGLSGHKKGNEPLYGLYYCVTREEIRKKYQRAIDEIEARLHPVQITGASNGKPIMYLATEAIPRYEYRLLYFRFLVSHLDRDKYYLTGDQVQSSELIGTQEEFPNGIM